MTDLRDVALYLGVQFIRTPNAIFLMQKSYCLQVLKEFDMLECSPATIILRSSATICNPVYHEQLKHIELWVHFVRENVLTGIVDILYTQTSDQIADLFTMPLGEQRFTKLQDELRIKNLNLLKSNYDRLI
uniref:Reverse transcriptase Ty1/copia-type domain-containing protein n=1 Tax=Physcomitrium patens TaxID=3218 RepID=A0A2K1JUB2_PHYPA|nr:hypothetical protein PHYPA_014881 [Physcomitrium patens]